MRSTGKRELAIERGIPIPGPKRPRTQAGVVGREMKPGDSVFTESSSEMETIRSAIYQVGGQASTRKTIENGVMGWRIWRKGQT